MKQQTHPNTCFVNSHCCYDCPNIAVDEFEERYDIPASDAGLERISCKNCHYQTGEREDCLFQYSKDCPKVTSGVGEEVSDESTN